MCVTVVIPNYNGRAYLHECLDALRLQTLKNFHIILVDNASTDGSAEEVMEYYPEVQVIRNPENYGFSKAVNQGIQAAETEFVFLLNNDAVCECECLEVLVQGMKKSPEIFSCGARMIQYHDHDKLDDAGDFYTIFGWPYQRGLDESVRKYKKAQRVFSCCGGAAMYRRDAVLKLGGFDEQFFAYLEDVDLGFRSNIYGYRNYYLPKAKVYHIGSASTGARYNPVKIRLAARNSIYLYYKNMPDLMLALHAPFLLAGHFVKYLFFMRKGFGGVYRQGIREAVLTRNEIQRIPFEEANRQNYYRIETSMLVGTLQLVKQCLNL